jgi:hypothetical protein
MEVWVEVSVDPVLRVHRVPLELVVDSGVRSVFVLKLKTVLNIFSNGDFLPFAYYTKGTSLTIAGPFGLDSFIISVQ